MFSSSRPVFGIVGLGSFGSTVAIELMRLENDVIGIDIDESVVSSHAEKLTHAMVVDGRDEAALREAGFEDVQTALVAVGEDLEASILATINLKLLGIKKVWAKATNRTHHRILSKLGADRVIHPEVEIGQHIAQMLHNPRVRDYLAIGNGYYVVVLRIEEKIAGKRLDELGHKEKFGLQCLGVMRGSDRLGGDGTRVELKEKDLLLMLGKRAAVRAFAEHIA